LKNNFDIEVVALRGQVAEQRQHW